MHNMAAFKRLKPSTLFKKRLWRRCFLVNFVKFLGTPFLQNTSGRLLLREGRRLKQIEISIISKLKKVKEKCSHIFLFFTCCAHPFCFRGSLFTNRSYVSLYSYFQYVQTCWIWKTYLNTYVKNKKIMLILKCHPRMKFHRCLSSRNEISSRQNHRQGWFHLGTSFILGWNFTCKPPLSMKSSTYYFYMKTSFDGLFKLYKTNLQRTPDYFLR